MKILTSLLCVFVAFIPALGFSNYTFVKLQSRTEYLEYEPTDLVGTFKQTVGQVFSLPAKRIKLIHAGAELKDSAAMGSHSFSDSSTLILLVRNAEIGEEQTSSKIDYPSHYNNPIQRANDAFRRIKSFETIKKKSGEEFIEEINLFKGQMESIVHYSLPTTFMTDLIARFPQEKGYSLFAGNQLPPPQELMTHAIAHMKDSLKPSSASEDIEALKKYLTNAISFQLALAYFVFDEVENDINNRFFKYDRASFIEHYEEFERARTRNTHSRPAYDIIREKINNAHTTITVRVYLDGQSYTIVGRRIDNVSFIKQELARQAKKAPAVKFSLGIHGKPLEDFPCPSYIEAKNKHQKMNDYSMFSDLEQFTQDGSIVIDAATL